MRALWPLILTVNLFAPYGRAEFYYVATRGNDVSPGSSDAPFRTLARGVRAAVAGDTVVVRSGVYGHEAAATGGDTDASQHSPVVLLNSGSPGAWITIKAEHKWGAVLDCEMICDSYIDLRNASYVVIQDFVITRGYKEGIHSNDAAHHIALKGNRIEYIANRSSSTLYGLDGMYTNPQCHDFSVDGNVFHDIGRTNQNWLDHALYLRGFNMSVTNNVFYNIPHGWPIQAADGLHNLVIANNTFAFGNGAGQDGQIMLWKTQSDLTIRNNIFYGARNNAITRHNSTVSSCTIDHNLIYGAAGILRDSSGCALDVNQMGADPKFVNASSPPYDFHLRSGSPAIRRGAPVPGVLTDIEGASRAAGTAPDLGAYAFPQRAQQ
jgi:hypothetical protein